MRLLALLPIAVSAAMSTADFPVSAAATPFRDRDASAVSGMLPCVAVYAHARYVAFGYDHVVALTNGCARDVTCDVSTDVNPSTVAVDVAVGATAEVVTFKGSPSTTFAATVACTLH